MNWDMILESQMGLTISADARLSHVDYTDDAIWELRRVNTEPACLAIQTTFGLRAHWARFFPFFTRRDVVLSDPTTFFQPPRIKCYYPNYLAVNFAPFNGVEVLAEYWAADSHTLAGRLRIANQSVLTEAFRFEWAGSLNPIGDGDKFSAVQMGVSQVLRGRSGGYFTVLSMGGNPQGNHSPFTSLAVDVELFPGNFRLFNWASATMPDPDEAFDLARKALTRAWDADISRMEMQNASQILEISTGNPAWDLAFDAAQKTAYSLVMPGNEHLPAPSFVTSRNPDQGFSLRRDGSDYTHHWSGQTPLDAWYLASLLLPGGVEVCKGLVDNFLSVQEEDGFIDLKPGLAGQRSRQLAQPLLAALTCKIAPYLGYDCAGWLEVIYPKLLKFFERWFKPENDRDQDGFPEWSHPLQSGLGDSPLYDVWQSNSQGVNILTLESPSLAAFLYRECQSLIKIARRIKQEEKVPWLIGHEAKLKNAIGECWNSRSKNYRYRDYLYHQCPDGKELLTFQGPGKFRVRRNFFGFQRLLINIKFQDEQSRPIQIKIVGEGENGETIEEASVRDVSWGEGRVFYTTRELFTEVSRLEVQGLGPADSGTLNTVDYKMKDISLLLPLWSGAVEGEQVKDFVENTILLQYMKLYGCPAYLEETIDKNGKGAGVYLPWNQFVGEGLVANGYRAAAADLVTRLMDKLSDNYQSTAAFRDFFYSGSGSPGGEPNTLHSLAPLGLFLDTLGILRLTPNLVILQDVNPFPFPVTVKYRGIKITRHTADTVITFPSGQTVTVNGGGTQQVVLP